MLKLRKEEGMGAVAKRLVPLVEKVNGEFVVYEGARSVEEVDQLRRKYGVVVIAINASPQARFRRLQRRGRAGKTRGRGDIGGRENRERGVGSEGLDALWGRVVLRGDTDYELQRET